MRHPEAVERPVIHPARLNSNCLASCCELLDLQRLNGREGVLVQCSGGTRPCRQSSSLFCCLNEIAQRTESLSNAPIFSLLVTGVLLPGSIEGWVLGGYRGPWDVQA